MADFKFQPKEREFSLINALGCARASSLVYNDFKEVSKDAVSWGFDEPDLPLTKGSHFGVVLRNPEIVLISFRGTDDKWDWVTNLNIFFKHSPLGWVHRGFMKACNLFWPDLPEKVSKLRDNKQSIWITGHSLGGALALLATVKLLVEENFDIAGLYTFGQPPVGTLGFCHKFVNRFPDRYFRFVNHTDAVSSAPVLMRKHVGEVRYFDRNGSLEEKPSWKVRFLDHFLAPCKHGGLSQFRAHSMKEYEKAIKKQIAEDERGMKKVTSNQLKVKKG